MFRRYVFLLFFASQLPMPALSQHRQKDSLFQLLRSRTGASIPKADTATVNLLNNISELYVQQVSDSAFLFADKALRTATQLNYPVGRAAAYANIAKMHYQKGNYLKSLKNALSTLELSNKANDKAGQANAYNLLGLIHLAQNNIQPALREFKQAETLNQELNDRHRVAANYFNQGLCYLQNKQMDSAVYYLLKSKDVSKIIDDRHMSAMSNNRLGDYYAQSGQTDLAIAFYKAVADNEAYQNDWENSFAYTGMAECYLKKKEYNQAVKYGEQGLMLARKTGTKWDIERALKVLYESSHALGRLSQAYDYLLMDKLYYDSLFNENKEKEINGLYLRQKQAENEVLIKKTQLIIQENRATRITTVIACLFVISLVFIALMLFRNSVRKSRLNGRIKQQNQELEELNKTKDQLFAVISHDLRSPFAAVLGALELLKNDELSADEKQLVFDSFTAQLTATAAMLENLLLWAESQQAAISTKAEKVIVPAITDQVLEVFTPIAKEKRISIDHYRNDEAIIAADPDHVSIILQNLLANAIKFTHSSGSITISYKVYPAIVNILVSDNGIGMTPAKLEQLFRRSGKTISTYGTDRESGTGIGLSLVKRFAKQNKATIHVKSEVGKGTVFELEFPRAVL